MMNVYMLIAYGGGYGDEFEDVVAVFASYSAMITWIDHKFKKVKEDSSSFELQTIPVIDEFYFVGSFKCLEDNEVVSLRYKSYDVIGEVDCKTDEIVFMEN